MNQRCEALTTESGCTSRSNCVWMDSSDECDDDSGDDGDDYDAGCCAGNSERSSTRCNAKDSAAACDRISSCHWIVTDDSSDCQWYKEDVEEESGCCYATTLQSMAFSSNLCAQYWNNNGCLVSFDVQGAHNCRWEATDDDVDCQGLMAFENAVRQHDEVKLFGADTMVGRARLALGQEVSVLTILVLFAALFAVYQVHRCWNNSRKKVDHDGYEKLSDGKLRVYETNFGSTNYQSMA